MTRRKPLRLCTCGIFVWSRYAVGSDFQMTTATCRTIFELFFSLFSSPPKRYTFVLVRPVRPTQFRRELCRPVALQKGFPMLFSLVAFGPRSSNDETCLSNPTGRLMMASSFASIFLFLESRLPRLPVHTGRCCRARFFHLFISCLGEDALHESSTTNFSASMSSRHRCRESSPPTQH